MVEFKALLVFIFFMGLFSFFLVRSHLLLILLSLEFISVCLYMVLFSCLFIYNFYFYFVMFFLVFIVCESALGLGILVYMIRMHGNDMILNLSVLGW